MPARDTTAIGFRLPNALIQAIETEAKRLGMSRNELVCRNLIVLFLRDNDDERVDIPS